MGFFGDLFGGLGSVVGAIPGLGAAGDIIQAGLGALGGVATGQEQSAELERQREWQSAENQKTRDFNAEEALKQRNWSTEMWNLQNRYNLPANQVRRLLAAGINPAAAFSGSSGSVGQSSLLPQGSAAASSNGSVTFPAYTGTRVGMEAMSVRGAYLKALAGAARDLSQVGVNRASVDEIYQRISNLMSEERLTDLRSQAQDISNQIVALTGKRKAEAEINKLIASAAVDVAEKSLKEAMTDVEREKWFEQYWKGLEAKMRALLGQKNFEKAEIELQFLRPMLQAQLQETKSRTARNNAESAHLNALTVLDKDSHAENVFNRAVKGFDEHGNVTNTTNFNALKDAIYQEARRARKLNEISDAELDRINTEIEKLTKDVEWYEFNAVVGGVTQILGSVANVRKAGAIGELFETQAAKYRYEMQYGNVDTFTSNYKDVDSSGKVYNITKTRTTRR